MTLDPQIKEALDSFKTLDQKITYFEELLGVVSWDLQIDAPKKGRQQRSNAIGALSTEVFELSMSDEMGACLDTLSSPEAQDQLDEVTRATVRVRKREYDKSKRIPADLYKEFVILTSNAHDIWEEARKTNNFEHYRPTLEKIVDITRQFADIYGYDTHPYNALLDNYEPGLTVETLDPLFKDLREKTIQLLDRIQQSPHQPRKEIFEQSFDIEKQKAFNLFVLPQLGYDMDAGMMAESAHPFATGLNTNDVRITTRYLENNMRSAIFGTIHECGHALYEQGIDSEYEGTALREGTSMGIHESQSRFLENMVGRSQAFWSYFYNDLKTYFPQQFEDVSLEDFSRAINTVEPSLIRVEADELTYNLHIMIRYEIEKGLLSGDIEVKDLPQVWNEKMEEYLGVVPPNDADGVLQDVHWSFGGFGYFPSYALGNLYAAQFMNQMKQDIPNLNDVIEKGAFHTIREWLKKHIHTHGKLYTPNELVQRVTGEELNAKYLTDYFEEKYADVYRLNQ
ncbi:carboxypeptidase M32 [Caldalkalibacillus salinus]|uniref:carboxypeptidase M32 n=1 Tax=Caldalkalibacillus salinus TaxID=2803787 RepID=UPI001924002D|nr:carboxypeptidase M32 [Caldalkalibacillus salinus]